MARPRPSQILSWTIAIVALLGLADATFLTVAHLTGDDAVCGSAIGCSEVLGSPYAEIRGFRRPPSERWLTSPSSVWQSWLLLATRG